MFRVPTRDKSRTYREMSFLELVLNFIVCLFVFLFFGGGGGGANDASLR